jgi:hypothetical protein
MCQCRSLSLSSKDNVDEDSCCVSKMQCCNTIEKRLDGLLTTHIFASWLVLRQSNTSFCISENGVLALLYDFCHPSLHAF